MINNITYEDTYHFYQSSADRSVICTTYYKGKLVKSIAKCDPNDSFDLETGKKLAYLRCKRKFLRRKHARAAEAYANAVVAVRKAEERRQNAIDFFNDTASEFREVNRALAELETALEA